MSHERRAKGSSKAGLRGAVLSVITFALLACGETSQSDDAVNGAAAGAAGSDGQSNGGDTSEAGAATTSGEAGEAGQSAAGGDTGHAGSSADGGTR